MVHGSLKSSFPWLRKNITREQKVMTSETGRFYDMHGAHRLFQMKIDLFTKHTHGDAIADVPA